MKAKITMVISLALILMVVFSAYSFGESVLDQPGEKMTYIDSYSGDIIHGTLSTTVKAGINGKTSVTSVKIKMELQKLSSGDYSTIETWEQTFSGRNGSMEESKITSPLNTYRLKATVTAYSGSNSESKTFYAY
jgi:hypothetical protein